MTALKYRPDIDGLRALMMALIFVFHAGCNLNGIFATVTVFFVIGGYVATSQIMHEIEEGRFALALYYERRARRMLPLLFLFLTACIPFSWALLPQDQMKIFAESAAANAVMLSNMYFFYDFIGLEGVPVREATHPKPLMHTWFLGIQMQFVILIPLLLTALARFGRGFTAAVLAVIMFVNIGVTLAVLQAGYMSSIYFISSRIWEVFAGALCALCAPYAVKTPARAASALSVLGAGMLVFIFLFFDLKTSPLVPYVAGAAAAPVLIIMFTQEGSFLGRALSFKPLVFAGAMTYSVYLWHYPVLTFIRYMTLDDLTVLLAPEYLAASALLTAGLSWLTWRYVENMFRDRNKITARQMWTACACAGGAIFVFGVAGSLSNGFEGLRPGW